MKLLIFSTLLLSVALAHAQATPTPKAPTQGHKQLHKIAYKRGLPMSISRLTPRGIKSCFWGEFRLKTGEPTYAIHLYKTKAQQGIIPSRDGVKQEFTLDIFQGLRRAKYRRINRVVLPYWTNWGLPQQFGVTWFWANTQEAKVPIFQFDIFYPSGYGDSGDNVFAAFTTGLIHKPTVQSLTFGGWHASDTFGAHNTVEHADDGVAQIQVKLSPASDPVDLADYRFTLRWNGEKFETITPLNPITKGYAPRSVTPIGESNP